MNMDSTGAKWFKSSRSGGGKDCVEVAMLDQAVAVRDSKNPAAAVLVFEPGEWNGFTTRLAAGAFGFD